MVAQDAVSIPTVALLADPPPRNIGKITASRPALSLLEIPVTDR